MSGYIERFLSNWKTPPRVLTETTKNPDAAVSVVFVSDFLGECSDSPAPDPAGPPVSELAGPAGSDGSGPPPADRGWRKAVELWPVEWRERWGRRANALQGAGAAWDVAEWHAFHEAARELVEADRRGEVTYSDPAPGMSDIDAVAAIDAAFAVPAPAGRPDRGPRDARRGPDIYIQPLDSPSPGD
jgi:hypothetical protein